MYSLVKMCIIFVTPANYNYALHNCGFFFYHYHIYVLDLLSFTVSFVVIPSATNWTLFSLR